MNKKEKYEIRKIGIIMKKYRPYYPLIYNFILFNMNPIKNRIIDIYHYDCNSQANIVYFHPEKPISKF